MRNAARVRKRLSNKAKIIGLATGAIAVWQIVTISLAAWHGDSEDLSAADYAEISQSAANAAASQRLTDSDFAGAKVFSTRSLSVSPIYVVPLRDLGLAEQGLGDAGKAAAIFSQTAALGWRDPAVQIWLAQAFLRQKDYGSAAQRIDAALRTNPTSTDMYDVVDQMIADPEFARAIAARLALVPNWRAVYFRHLDGISAETLAARSRLLNLLSGTAAPSPRDEIIPTLYVLTRADQAPLARMLWLRSQHIDQRTLFDSVFANAAAIGTAPFEWTIERVAGATLAIDKQGTADAILHVTTDGTAAGVLIHEILALPPGPHSLSYSGTMSPAARNAFTWVVRCVRNGKTLLNSLGEPPAAAIRFEVPADCASQQVALMAVSSAAGAGSEARFKRLDIR